MSIMPQTRATIGEIIEAKALVLPRTRTEIGVHYARQHHPARVYLNGLQSAHSRETMEDRLEAVCTLRGASIDTFPWTELDFPELEAIRRDLEADDLAFTTVNLTLSAVRGVLRAAWHLKLMSAEQCQRACAVKNLKGSRMPPGRVLEDDEIARLRRSICGLPGMYGALLRGLCGVFVGAGLRREEVCRLPLEGLRGRALRVVGKGNKEREIPLGKTPLADLRAWLETRRALKVPHDAMFVRVRVENDQDVVVIENPIGIDTMDRVIKQWARLSAGPDFPVLDANGDVNVPPPITPHDLRRTFITRLLDNGVDVLTVQRLAGHASSKTTERYDRRGEKAAERAIDEHGVY